MAHDSSTPANRRLKKPESAPNRDEKWKTSPSTETTSDEGNNARLAEEHERQENSPARRSTPKKRP
jgi:hypothetical protein